MAERALLRHLGEIRRARERIAEVVRTTPLQPSRAFSEATGARVLLKLENFQRTGSFKIRGALSKLSRAAARHRRRVARGVVAASAGNHAQGVALAAALTGVAAHIVMPEGTPEAKTSATRDYGAEVVLHGDSYEEAYRFARAFAERKGLPFVHAFDDPDVIAGQGTVGLELLEQCPKVDVCVVPVGGGGLISGIALALRALSPSTRIVGVQAAEVNAFERSLREGSLLEAPPSGHTIAEGIACRRPGRLAWSIVRRRVDAVVSVTDEEIVTAIGLLLERAKVVAEAAGAASSAALLHGRLGDLSGKTVVAIVSGGNLDVALSRPAPGSPSPTRASLLVEFGNGAAAGNGGSRTRVEPPRAEPSQSRRAASTIPLA